MAIGPVSATQKLMARLGLSIGDLDAFKLNEAFASQSLAVLRALGLPDDAQDVTPIAVGPPLAIRSACRARVSL